MKLVIFLLVSTLLYVHVLAVSEEEEEQRIRNLIIPGMIRRPGGNWKVPFVPGLPAQTEKSSSTSEELTSESSSESYEDEYDNYIEPECSEDKFYFIRRRRCVPIHCPKVYVRDFPRRDAFTGECSMDLYGKYMTRHYVEGLRIQNNKRRAQLEQPCRRPNAGLVPSHAICSYVG
ncbi:Catalase-peroxidase [Orchesella cincta]|uniref:Catalase-peroxidase n=1 Tax=Orchesella cincta TaxID=48709 RepID=A0A1D2NFQ0_ORCCI|nr:Catalase-peroxidase [Orchesella cincta]